MSSSSFQVRCRVSIARRILAICLAVAIVAVGVLARQLFLALDCDKKSASGPLMLSLLGCVVVIGMFWAPIRGTLTVDAGTLIVEDGRRTRVIPLGGATMTYGKWMQQYVGTKGTVLNLHTSAGVFSIGGQQYLFENSAFYNERGTFECDAWLSAGRFRSLMLVLADAIEGATPVRPEPALPARGYREASPELAPREAPRPVYLDVELFENPSSAKAMLRTNVTVFAVVLPILMLGGACCFAMVSAQRSASGPVEWTVWIAAGVVLLMVLMGICVALWRRSREREFAQLRFANGSVTLHDGRGEPIVSSWIEHLRVSPALHVTTVTHGTTSLPCVNIGFPSGQQVSIGAYGSTLWGFPTVSCSAPNHLVGAGEWELLLDKLRLPHGARA